MRRQWWAACAVLALLGTACADDAYVAQPDIDLEHATRVDALDNSFRAQTLTVSAGTQVVFVNVGRNVHDVKPAGGSSDWGVDQRQFAPGALYAVRFETPGLYPYYCSIHGTEAAGMTGTIEVTA